MRRATKKKFNYGEFHLRLLIPAALCYITNYCTWARGLEVQKAININPGWISKRFVDQNYEIPGKDASEIFLFRYRTNIEMPCLAIVCFGRTYQNKQPNCGFLEFRI